jgi:hypothetical protein
MKMKRFDSSIPFLLPSVVALLLATLLTSCALIKPGIHYLGDTFAPTDTLQVYYNEKDIRQPYRVMGKMTNDMLADFKVEQVKSTMIEKAKKVGADGILFSDVSVERDIKNQARVAVKAELIKFQ